MRAKAREAARAAGERSVAMVDARNLALELAGIVTAPTFDPMRAGVVLQPGEVGYRMVSAWLRQRVAEGWTVPSWSQVLVTDQRLLVRLGTGELASLWWGSLVGFEADLAAEHVVMDYGDGHPRLLSGLAIPVIAVAGVASVYGVEAMLAHPALAPLRMASHVSGPASHGGPVGSAS